MLGVGGLVSTLTGDDRRLTSCAASEAAMTSWI